jgi:hypothetical protein
LDLEFYARFLALYISKLKRDWVKKDEDFSCRGPKKYYDECWTKRTLKTDAKYKKNLKKFEKHPEYFEPSFEDVTQDAMRKLEKRARMKRKKKSFKLWNNCIPLSEYSGNQNINCQYMIKRRELRYKFEIVNYAVFGFEKKKKEKDIIYKGLINSSINEPGEPRLEILDR